MNKIFPAISLSLMLLASGACSHKNENMNQSQNLTHIGTAVGFRNSKPVNAIPKAKAFRMSGDYAGNVAITLNANGSLAYFPDPSDISANSVPIDLGDGWWLNLQGISTNSVFTRYTFPEYAALKKVPSISELKAAVIPGARVVEMRELPFTISEAPQHLDSIRSYLKSGKGGGHKLSISF